jgi:alcohol dehydrogenase class IV
MSTFVSGMPLPQRLRELGAAEGELAEIARLTMSDYMMANLPRPMYEAVVLALLRSAW